MNNDDRTLYIGNLDRNVTEEILYELFLQAGPIERVNIPNNNNESYRFGFVTYKHDCSIEYAIDLFKGTNLYKKQLTIKKKSTKGQGNGQVTNTNSDQNWMKFPEIAKDLCNVLTNFPFQNNSIPNDNLASSSLKGNWSARNKPYKRNKRVYPRQREFREKHHSYHGNKMYHSRKNRHRD